MSLPTETIYRYKPLQYIEQSKNVSNVMDLYVALANSVMKKLTSVCNFMI